jgi:hypothetical protein
LKLLAVAQNFAVRQKELKLLAEAQKLCSLAENVEFLADAQNFAVQQTNLKIIFCELKR